MTGAAFLIAEKDKTLKNTHTKNLFSAALACGLAAVALLGAVAPANAAEKKPNIVFILTDNLGWRARTEKELALMADLVPLLKKRAGGRDISGLSAYEQ